MAVVVLLTVELYRFEFSAWEFVTSKHLAGFILDSWRLLYTLFYISIGFFPSILFVCCKRSKKLSRTSTFAVVFLTS